MVAAAIFVPILVPMFFSVIQKTRETLKRTGNMENNKGLAGQSAEMSQALTILTV